MSDIFSRGANTNPFGKCTEELKTQVPEEIREQLHALAALKGQTPSEYLRNLIIIHLHGHFRHAQQVLHSSRES